jgi:tetratricopeptide (TPR) repeat protein
LHKHDLAAAQAAIDQALQLDPKSPEAHLAKGISEVFKKNQKAAAAEFKVAAELAPPRSNIQMNYAEYKRQTEGAKSARAFLQDLTKKAPDFLPPWVLLGKISLAEKKYDAALAELENVLARDNENLDARLLQSEIYLAKGQTDKAMAELAKLDKTYPRLPAVKFRMAQADLQQEKAVQAAATLDEAIAESPGFTDAILLRARLSLRTGHADQAVTALEELLKKQPGVKAAQLLLADAYRGAGRLDDAAAIIRDQIKSAPQSPENYLFLGILQQQQQKLAEARQSFEKVLELSPDSLVAVDQLVSLDLQEKKIADATRMVQDQIKKHPGIAVPYLLQARVLIAEKKWTEAEAVLKKALQLSPDSASGYDMLVRCYMATDKLPDAVQELETVIAKAPKNEGAMMTLATIREQQKDYKSASEAYERLLAQDPSFVPALNNLSYLYAERLNQPDKAYALAQKARSLAPGNPAVADTLGWAAYKRGDYQQALPFLQEAAGKLNDKPEIAFHLGMANYMMGQAEAAGAAFKQALSQGESFPSADEAKRRLALLDQTGGGQGAVTAEQLQAMLREHPTDVMARTRLAEVYQKQGNFAGAAQAYEEALKTNPKLAPVVLRLAQLYDGPLADNQKALAFARQARDLAPNDPHVAGILGRIAFDLGNFSWAYSLLQDSSRQLETDATVLHDFAWAAYSLSHIDQARDAMQKCLGYSPAPAIAADATSFLSMTAAVQNPATLRSVKADIAKALAKDPHDVPALMAAALMDEQEGDRKQAVERYREVLKRFPDFGPAQLQLASLYAGDPSRSAEAYDLAGKARRNLPKDPAVARLLGELCYKRKDFPRALQLLQESSRQQPLDAEGLYYLGLSFQEAKQSAEATEALSQALAKGLPPGLRGNAEKSLQRSKKK